MIINWSKLQPYKKTKQKSFEQLCYQIAVKLFKDEGVFSSLDDSGGGDGVEFYLTLDNGEQWGWQAKYYEGSTRLKDHNRKQKIVDSLKRAIDVHPNLTIWYLCLPTDLTPDEIKWFNTQLPKHIPKDRRIEIGERYLWNESFIHEKINNPKFNGLKQAFFNELELTNEWFLNAFINSFAIVNNKFDEQLYVPNEEFEYWYVNPILCNEKFIIERIGFYPRKIQEISNKLITLFESFNLSSTGLPSFKDGARDVSGNLNKTLEIIGQKVQSKYQSLNPIEIFRLTDNFSAEIAQIENVKTLAHELLSDIYERNRLLEGTNNNNLYRKTLNILSDIQHSFDELLSELNYYIRDSRIPCEWRIANYIGNAGDGKTNFAIALAKSYLESGFPAIFIPALKFTGSNPLQEQILSLLDLKSDYTFNDFLDCLDGLGLVFNKRIPIIFDGLNEALNSNGFLNDRLRIDLPVLEHEILRRQTLVLMTTCRGTYKDAIWGKVTHMDERFHTVLGFTDEIDKRKLIRRYFEHYKIQADLSFLSLQRFRKPLFLKIFCETANPGRNEPVQVTLGYDSIYSIFEKFIGICDFSVFNRIKRLGKPPIAANQQIASKVLKLIGKRLWTNPTRAFPLEELMLISDGSIDIDFNTSITKALLDEELLFIRNWSNTIENVYLTYDMMTGYIIADYLINSITDFGAFFHSNMIDTLINEEHERLHPNYEDILDSLFSLLPIKKGLFVHELVDIRKFNNSEVANILLEKSIKCMVLLSPEFIKPRNIELVEKVSDDPRFFNQLLDFCTSVLFVSNHPFNFSFWSEKLKRLSIKERDSLWTEYLRRTLTDGFIDNLIEDFELLQLQPDLTNDQHKKLYLVANFLVWNFTSTNNGLRKKASSALYCFGIKFSREFFDLYYFSVEINDPTVLEWMSMTLYCVLIFIIKKNAHLYENEFREIASFIKEKILSANGTYSTNHIIIRNYSFDSLRLLVKNLSLGYEIEEIKKGFRSIGVISWKESGDRNAEYYKDGNSLIDYFFEKEKMPHIMVGKGDEYNQTREYKKTKAKLRWRAYQLGYDFQLFGEIDKEIAGYRHYEKEDKRTHRYADKYIEIAFFEYCGFLDGLGKFDSYNKHGYLRTFDLKHDTTGIKDGENNNLPSGRFVKTNYVDENVSLEEWCGNITVPNVSPFLTIDRFQEKEGKFVLLDGLVHQYSAEHERQIFFKIDTVFIKNKSIKSARKAFNQETKLGFAAHSIPNTLQLHESEIPDGSVIPYNDFTIWNFTTSSKKVSREYVAVDLIENGKILDENKANSLWESSLKSHNYHPVSRTRSIDFPIIHMKFSSDEPVKSIEEIFKDIGIELRERVVIRQQEEKIEKQLKVFVPVRRLKERVYLCKNLTDYFKLSSRIGETDLYDEKGVLASFNHTYEVEYYDQEGFTYIQKNLLDKYLKDQELTMFTIIWGERDYFPKDGDWSNRTSKIKERKWSKFYDAIEYSSIKK